MQSRHPARRLLWLGTVLLLGSGLAQAATYYVSTTGNTGNSCGTASAPTCSGGTCSKPTIQAGIACMAGGDTLLVNSGTYTQDPIAAPPTGTAAQYTIVRSMNGKAATTLICNNIALDALFYAGGHNFIEVDGFTFDGNNLCAVAIGGSSGNDITVKNSEVTRGRHHGAEIVKNLQRWTLNNNEIHHNGTDVDQHHGVYFSAQNSTIHHNYFHHNACWGMQVQTGEGDPPVPQSDKVYGNIFELNGCGGLTTQQGSNHEIVNNVFVNEATNPDGAPNNSFFDFAVPNGIVYNNTFYCSTMREIEYNTVGAIVANNLFYCPGVTLTIQRRTGGTFGATYTNNMLNQDPNFVNVNAPATSGFKLNAGSIAINAVPCRAQASPDAAGIARPQPAGGQCDYGAYEFTTGAGSAKKYVCIQDGVLTAGTSCP